MTESEASSEAASEQFVRAQPCGDPLNRQRALRIMVMLLLAKTGLSGWCRPCPAGDD
jgi:hypothetical protein